VVGSLTLYIYDTHRVSQNRGDGGVGAIERIFIILFYMCMCVRIVMMYTPYVVCIHCAIGADPC
jgi:hypothetical protein